MCHAVRSSAPDLTRQVNLCVGDKKPEDCVQAAGTLWDCGQCSPLLLVAHIVVYSDGLVGIV